MNNKEERLKWIWVQEDYNYPEGKGREISMKGIRKLRDELSKAVK